MSETKTIAKDAASAIQAIFDAAASLASVNERRYPDDCPVDTLAHQGDVYLLRVKDNHPRGKRLPDARRQVAPGNEPGSRHVVECKDRDGNLLDIELYEPVLEHFPEAKRMLIGPVVVAKHRFELTHPEHATHSLPAGVYQVGFQLDVETRMRVQD